MPNWQESEFLPEQWAVSCGVLSEPSSQDQYWILSKGAETIHKYLSRKESLWRILPIYTSNIYNQIKQNSYQMK